MNAPNKNVIEQWIEKAEEDFRTAEYTLTMPEHCPYTTICFHCQQCVEKYLKAILISRAIGFPRIHDIGELIVLLPSEVVLSITEEQQECLSDYAVISRYPMEGEPITQEDAQEALEVCKVFRKEAKTYL